MNDIVKNLLSITRLFADNTSLAFTSSSLADLEGTFNHDLRIISSWARRWLVDFNPSKMVAMLFTLKKINNPTLLFNNIPVNFVDHHKHLGVTLSHDTKWYKHINSILSSAAKISGMMTKLK